MPLTIGSWLDWDIRGADESVFAARFSTCTSNRTGRPRQDAPDTMTVSARPSAYEPRQANCASTAIGGIASDGTLLKRAKSKPAAEKSAGQVNGGLAVSVFHG